MIKNPLTQAFVTGNLENFKRLLSNGQSNKEMDEATGISVFEKLCHTPKSSEFIRVCLHKFATDPNFLLNHFMPTEKSDSSNKYPIHFAAESLDADNLRVLLEFDKRVANPTNCNELTPLHIVIDNLNDNNVDQAFEAIKLLLEFDADMNCPSFKASFNTPFSLLLDKVQTLSDESKRNEILKYVEEHTLYIDTTSHPHRLTNTQEMLKAHFPELHDRLLTEDYTGMDEEPIYEKLIEHLDMSEKKFFQELCTLQQNMDYSETIFRILKDGQLYVEAVEKGQYESVKKLIDMGANPVGYTSTSASAAEDSESALMIACKHGHWRILALMLEKAPQFDCKTLKTPLLHYIIRNTRETGLDIEIDHYKCFDLVINKDDIDVNELDECDNTALCCAINAQNGVYMRKILGKSAFIGYMNIFIETQRPNIPLLENIPPDILENYFDSCITSDCYTPGDDKFELKIDYSCFVSPAVKLQHFVGELTPIHYMSNSKKYQHLVNHPLITSLLFLKWFRMRPVFYLNILLYAIGCISLIVYVVGFYGHGLSGGDIGSWVFWVMTLVFAAVYLLIREFLQLIATPNRYFQKLDNYFELVLIVLIGLVLSPEGWFGDAVRRGLGAITILLAVLELILLIDSLPTFSVSSNILLIKTVTNTFLNIFTLYAIIIAAFGFSFYTLFGLYGQRAKDCDKSKKCSDNVFNNFFDLGQSMLKTVVMFAGEFEASNIDFQQNVVGYIVFLVFVFFMAIVMINLLNGLAVTDTQMIRSHAQLKNWLMRAQHLSKYEDKILAMRFTWLNIIFFPNMLPANAIVVKAKQLENFHYNEIVVPQSFASQHAGKRYMKKLTFLKQNATLDDEIIGEAMKVLEKQQQKKLKMKPYLDERLDSIENKLNNLLHEKNKGKH